MRLSFALAALSCALAVVRAEGPKAANAPLYATSSIVNAASNQTGPLAPNTIASLYGSDLAWVKRGLTTDDIRNDELPKAIIGAGVQMTVSGLLAHLYFVSPGQVNFLVPANLTPGTHEIRLALDSRYGPAVKVQVQAAAPALFQSDPEFAIAVRVDGSAIVNDSPARPGEVVVLYATGLGRTRPDAIPGKLAASAAPLDRLREFQVQLNETPLDPAAVFYAGLAPGFAGLYQINLVLPQGTPNNPEIRIGFDRQMSPAKIRLPVRRLQ